MSYLSMLTDIQLSLCSGCFHELKLPIYLLFTYFSGHKYSILSIWCVSSYDYLLISTEPLVFIDLSNHSIYM